MESDHQNAAMLLRWTSCCGKRAPEEPNIKTEKRRNGVKSVKHERRSNQLFLPLQRPDLTFTFELRVDGETHTQVLLI